VVVDGAQDFCHVGADLQGDCADLYLSGTHKWLGSYHPLGLAFYGKRRSRDLVEAVLHDSLRSWHLDDPLLRFLHGGDGKTPCPQETVNLSGLFACQGAVSDAAATDGERAERLGHRVENAQRVMELAKSAGWIPEMPHASLQSGILLLKSGSERVRSLPAESLRARWHQQGVAVTAYVEGRVRASMPVERLSDDELRRLQTTFEQVA
jgi:hypothetical protein